MEWGRAPGWGLRAPGLRAGPDGRLALQVWADVAAQMASRLTPLTLLLLLLAGVSGPFVEWGRGLRINPSGPGE